MKFKVLTACHNCRKAVRTSQKPEFCQFFSTWFLWKHLSFPGMPDRMWILTESKFPHSLSLLGTLLGIIAKVCTWRHWEFFLWTQWDPMIPLAELAQSKLCHSYISESQPCLPPGPQVGCLLYILHLGVTLNLAMIIVWWTQWLSTQTSPKYPTDRMLE